jgi:hypothetical protein
MSAAGISCSQRLGDRPRRSHTRRTGAERGFATAKDPATSNIRRGWCRLIGLTPLMLFTMTLLIVRNQRIRAGAGYWMLSTQCGVYIAALTWALREVHVGFVCGDQSSQGPPSKRGHESRGPTTRSTSH